MGSIQSWHGIIIYNFLYFGIAGLFIQWRVQDFSYRWRVGGGCQHQKWKREPIIFPENCMELKEIGLGVSLGPPPPPICQFSKYQGGVRKCHTSIRTTVLFPNVDFISYFRFVFMAPNVNVFSCGYNLQFHNFSLCWHSFVDQIDQISQSFSL